ncbi:MAG: SUMF1/EgtB/PvdO family nonheme iron enzyme [Candidatus Eisenbacteria bacterium]
MLTKRAELAGLLMFVLFLLVLSCGKDNPESPNIDPVASFTVSPASGTTETIFQFDASGCSDAEDTPISLQVRWDWENDGTWDTQWSTTKTVDHQFATVGTKTVKLEVKDTQEAADDTTRTLTVSAVNTAPTASFTVSPASGTTDTVFQFDASGCSDAQDAVSVLQVRWDWENDGWDTNWSTIKTASHKYGTTGPKAIKLEVKDTGSLADDTTRVVTVTGPGLTLPEMVHIPAGTFTMGDGVADCGEDQHQVTLTHSFYLGKYEVTNKEYRDALQWAYDHGYVAATSSAVHDNLDGSTALLVDLVDSNCQISFSSGVFTVDSGKENHPVMEVSWYGAAAYCDWLSLQAGYGKAYNHSTWQCNNGNPYTAAGYRLPTDAEWEYATQYGGERIYPWGDESPDCSRANFYNGYYCVGSTSPVGSYELGKSYLGLYDMAGNVWEWCNDWHTCYPTETEDPKGPSAGSSRVLRGGSWRYYGSDALRCAFRYGDVPSYSFYSLGFRCARRQ